MRITRRQLKRIIREATGDQLPYSMGGPWVDKDAPVKRGAEQYDDLDMELSDKEIEDAMGWEPAEEYDEGDGDHAEYDRGYDDYLHSLGEEDPAMPDNPEYMRGWDSADIDSYKPGGQMYLGADK